MNKFKLVCLIVLSILCSFAISPLAATVNESTVPAEPLVSVSVKRLLGYGSELGWLIINKQGIQFRSGEELNLTDEIYQCKGNRFMVPSKATANDNILVRLEFIDNTDRRIDTQRSSGLLLELVTKIVWKKGERKGQESESKDVFLFMSRADFIRAEEACNRWQKGWK